MPDLVDCALPSAPDGGAPLLPYLAERWRRHLERFGARRPASATTAAIPVATAELALGVVVPPSDVASDHNLELAAALATAANDWQLAEPLERDRRLRGSVVVPLEDTAMAVAEIGRRATDRRFVQVLVPPRGQAPLGDRRYAPILDAAAGHGLPLVLTGEAPAHLASLVFNGAFERLPKLRVLVVDDGVAWVPPFTWRLDGSWKLLKEEVPDLKRLPSEYLRDRCWFAVGPDAARLQQVASLLGHDDRVVYAGGGAPEGLPPKVRHDNALDLYADRI